MKVLKILLSNCTFFTSQPAYGKTFNHWSKTLSGVLKIFSLVKHRNAAIFLVTISQINIPTTKTKKLIFGTIQIWLFSNPSLVTCLGTGGEYSPISRDSCFCVILRLKQNWSLLFLKSFRNGWKLSNIFWTVITSLGVN